MTGKKTDEHMARELLHVFFGREPTAMELWHALNAFQAVRAERDAEWYEAYDDRTGNKIQVLFANKPPTVETKACPECGPQLYCFTCNRCEGPPFAPGDGCPLCREPMGDPSCKACGGTSIPPSVAAGRKQ